MTIFIKAGPTKENEEMICIQTPLALKTDPIMEDYVMTKYLHQYHKCFALYLCLLFFIVCLLMFPVQTIALPDLRRVDRTINVVPSIPASFTYRPTSPVAGQPVQFKDTSTGSPTSWQWDFGDGTGSTSQNPSHTYATAASYTVTLTVADSSGSNTVSQTVTVVWRIAASFSYSPTSPVVLQPVQFMDTSTGSPTSWQWDFGDGMGSTSQNPSHTYATAASYLVSLTAANNYSSMKASRAINILPIASFTYSPPRPVAYQAVHFTDTSAGSPTSWQWDFGDGTGSISQNPSHTYTTAMFYTVTLTVTNSSGTNSVIQTINVTPEAAGYYIDTDNPIASDSNPGTAALPWKTITKANQTLVAGDTVYIKAGIYTTYIAPSHSGTASSRIIYRNYSSDTVTVQNASYGIWIDGKSYITVQGINFQNLDRFMWLLNGANHNIIARCNFGQMRNIAEWTGSRIMNQSSHNWVHHCRFSKYGYYTNDDIGCILDIGTEEITTDLTGHNLIEDNVMFHGGHHVLGVFGMYNVIRNNYFHNEPWSMGTAAADRGAIMYGDRNLYFAGYADNSGRNLIEGNQIGYSSDPPDNVGACGMLLVTSYNIVRFNRFYHNDRAGLAMGLTSSYVSDIMYNKVYNNTFFHNGINTQDPVDHMNSGIGFGIYSGTHIIKYNAFKNNLLYRHRVPYGTYHVNLSDQIFASNWDGDTQGNPQFVNASDVLGDPMDSSLPDLQLISSSPCRDSGTYLTTITSSSGSGTTFQVADAGYFMDGWGIPRVDGDEIQIVGTSQKARVTMVDYGTNTITVDTSLTWTQNQGVALAYMGSAPDVGAYEYGSFYPAYTPLGIGIRSLLSAMFH